MTPMWHQITLNNSILSPNCPKKPQITRLLPSISLNLSPRPPPPTPPPKKQPIAPYEPNLT